MGYYQERVLNLKKKVRIALVGKYVELPDAYISVVEALYQAYYVGKIFFALIKDLRNNFSKDIEKEKIVSG
ncbi:hypothetical protein EfmAA94_06880 [Enterococcus faecium]|nr:hypothetical protein EfmAA94_06880 [Enterococcus faecium]